jgi:hypothetical protein
VYVADGRAGTIVVFRSGGGALVRDGAVLRAGPRPHGAIRFHRGALYVAVQRGIAVVHPERGATTTVPLPVTPSDLWLTPSGRVFAALPGIERLAIVDTRTPGSAPRMVAAVPEPVAVTSAAGSVLVVGAGGDVARLAPRTGRVLGRQRVAALDAAPTRPLVLRRIDSGAAAGTLRLTLRLDGGALDGKSLLVRDATIADGAASFELWQGGIDSRVRTSHVGELTVGVGVASGRLEVALGAPTGSYERLRIERLGPRAIRVTMRETPAPVTRSGGSTTGGSTTGGSTSGGTTQQPKPPTKPKRPAYDVG